MRHALFVITSGIILAVALQAKQPTLRLVAAGLGAGGLGFTTMSMVLAAERQRKQQAAMAQSYLDFLQRLQDVPAAPRSQRPRACRGCQHYHGKVYGGQRLICGMYPYGVEGDVCADWNGGIQPNPPALGDDALS
ncbi:hypothetical protein [Leptolyngbya sp. CCY15150]|uniref:hypothetical protein n=1 Tax=Leptolyngbya sp. CCY15150 TaxID=2767772 RepID=UPI00194DC446|nr:hypothetical protein [Leptolyngbya sp. CCY15150]